MKWKQLEDTKDVIIYEKKVPHHNIRIEARHVDKIGWQIFKTYFNDKTSRYSEEYSAKNKQEVKSLVNNLLHEKDLNKNEINDIIALKKEAIEIKAKRIFKDEYTEKFMFSLDKFTDSNFILVHYSDFVIIDMIIHERYKPIEEQVKKGIIEFLGVEEDYVKYHIFYYSSYNTKENTADALGVNFTVSIE